MHREGGGGTPETGDETADPALEERAVGADTVYVDTRAAERGSKGAFLPAYRTPEADRKYGWYCTNCETLDNAMDSMGRIECNVCSNFRKPTEWDAAHE